MKHVVNYAVFGAVVAIAAGLFGAYGTTGLTAVPESSSMIVGAPMLGHITFTHQDTDGNVIAYRQTDNIIVNQGENCVAGFLFGVASTGTNATCDPVGNSDTIGAYRVIAIGNGSNSATAVSSDIALADEHTFVGSMVRQTVPVPTGANFTEASGDTNAVNAQVILSALFTNDAATAQTITVDESGIFNNTVASADGMFARQSFSSIELDDGESLTVEWTIDIGGTGNALGNESN